MRVLGLCGSLRRASRCAALLDAAAGLAPVGVVLDQYNALGTLPLFNPDLGSDYLLPQPVRHLWQHCEAADALLIASPEYAHGVTGVLKNALDWLVGNPLLPGTPVGVLNPAARASHADAALKEILSTMSLDVVAPACVCVDVVQLAPGVDAICASPARVDALRQAMAALHDAAARRRQPHRAEQA